MYQVFGNALPSMSVLVFTGLTTVGMTVWDKDIGAMKKHQWIWISMMLNLFKGAQVYHVIINHFK